MSNEKKPTTLAEERRALRASAKAFPWKKLGLFVLIFLPVAALYYVGVAFEWKAILPIYFALALITGVAYAVINRGIMGKIPKKEELNETWDDEKKEAFLAEAKCRKEKTAWLLTVFLAFLTVFFIESVLMLLDTAGIWSVG